MIGILASRADEASLSIARALLDRESPLEDRYRLEGAEVRVIDEIHVEATGVDERFESDPEWIAVVSRHAGDTGALLTAHFPGNVDDAAFGGQPRTVPPACPGALARYVDAVGDRLPAGYERGLECTHHGPTDSTVPLLYVEIGSDASNWTDPAAARAVADALWSVRGAPADADRQLVGLGGGHYAPRFERILRETDWAVGHIAPDWALEDLDESALRAVLPPLFEASNTDYALVTGVASSYEALVEELGYHVVGERWLRASSALSIPVLERLEADVEPVSDGLTVGDRRVDRPEDVQILQLSGDLLRACHGTDPAATRALVAAHTVAYGTDDEGSTPVGTLAVPRDLASEPLLEAIVEVLESDYDEITVEGTTLRARRRAFDPAAARDRGVPEGPLFGRLAGGEAVTVDGDRVDPDAVSTEVVDRFDVSAVR